LQSLNPSNVRAAHHGLAVRDHFTNYFTSPAGSIPWQYYSVNESDVCEMWILRRIEVNIDVTGV
jgi:hypothetical protein